MVVFTILVVVVAMGARLSKRLACLRAAVSISKLHPTTLHKLADSFSTSETFSLKSKTLSIPTKVPFGFDH